MLCARARWMTPDTVLWFKERLDKEVPKGIRCEYQRSHAEELLGGAKSRLGSRQLTWERLCVRVKGSFKYF